jgi:DAK2 domain fusion protein YloV
MENLKEEKLLKIAVSKKIQYMDGLRLNRAISSGIRYLVSRQDYLNKINVFPVPDGDTGTNMAFTLTSVLEASVEQIEPRVDVFTQIISDAAIDGARGNSGVLIAQFFVGFAEGCENKEKLDCHTLVKAFKNGALSAREAMEDPREGTILTVFQDLSDEIELVVENGTQDIYEIMKIGYKAACKSLEETPQKLKILKKAGVVDAGAQGFVDFLTGMMNFMKDGSLKDVDISGIAVKEPKKESEGHHYDEDIDINYRYCTECRIKGANIDKKDLRGKLKKIGDSLIVAGSSNRIHVHIHSNKPAQVFSMCERFGDVDEQKADDMFHQQQLLNTKNTQKRSVAIVTDSASDFMDDNLNIYVVPLRYSFGSKGYIDKVSQTSSEFYKELRDGNHHPQTSQPSAGDFKKQYQFLSSHYETIISLHIPKSLSGTYQSAKNASKQTPDAKITVIDTNNASVGNGLIVKYAAKLVKAGKTHEEVLSGINEAIEKTQIYIGFDNLNSAVKGGRIKPILGSICNFLNIKPIMSIKKDGSKLKPVSGMWGKKYNPHKFANFLIKKIDSNKTYDLAIAHSICEENAEHLRKILYEKCSNIKSISILELGCALGSHSGPGTLAVGLQEHLSI